MSAPRSLAWIAGATGSATRGVAVAIHGLNIRPTRMAAIVAQLNGLGYEVYVCALRGHGANYRPLPGATTGQARLAALQRVNQTVWLRDVLHVYRLADARSRRLGAGPPLLAAYSLGALLACNLALSMADVRFARMLLIAPALAVHPAGKLLDWAAPFPRLVVPSLTPADYRTNRGTPVAAYRALYAAIREFENASLAPLNVPALILMDPQDELVSYRSVKALAARSELARWHLAPIVKGADATKPYRHLIIDPASAGSTPWAQMTALIARHVSGSE